MANRPFKPHQLTRRGRGRVQDGDDQAPPLPETKKAAAIPGVKEQVTLRIDRDILDHFQEGGPGWQDRIVEALRKAAGK